ncbi:hypothetical protein LSH36_164g00017 [Paralvinella palmiformis]|uniref:Uncharacterized protein n=1 Tax=Paralvinella palmiformis TaxID=53620 RepID=A0AAD9JTA4_9ANNE|nr:hypothetical protein LSH36_164g00017 [Paralvinella palmiformis]
MLYGCTIYNNMRLASLQSLLSCNHQSEAVTAGVEQRQYAEILAGAKSEHYPNHEEDSEPHAPGGGQRHHDEWRVQDRVVSRYFGVESVTEDMREVLDDRGRDNRKQDHQEDGEESPQQRVIASLVQPAGQTEIGVQDGVAYISGKRRVQKDEDQEERYQIH